MTEPTKKPDVVLVQLFRNGERYAPLLSDAMREGLEILFGPGIVEKLQKLTATVPPDADVPTTKPITDPVKRTGGPDPGEGQNDFDYSDEN